MRTLSRRIGTGSLLLAAAASLLLCGTLINGCNTTPSSDSIQNAKQEQLNAQAVATVGMPAITNFTEKRQLKAVYELRDQANLVTYSYIENEMPTVVKGKTALGGKFTFLGVTRGYGIPYATEYTNPAQAQSYNDHGVVALPQADPNGLYSPASADGTWLILQCPDGEMRPVYMEPKVAVYPYKLPFD